MKLVIVESPNKINKIKSFLPSDFEVIATYGHIMDLSTTNKFGLGIDLDTFTPLLTSTPKQKKTISNIQKISDKADEIYLSTDPDREGEAIAYHLTKILNNDKPIFRASFNEISKEAITNSINNPTDINYQLVESQECRRMLDRIIGFRLSFLTAEKLSAKSAGRVKSSTLKLIIDREREIALYQVDKWFNIQSDIKDTVFINSTKDYVPINYESEMEANIVFNKLGISFKKVDEKTTRKTIKAPVPFEMSSFLTAMYTNYKYSAKKSTAIAQKLYEKGFITYPRTDSTRISSKKFISEVSNYITYKYGGLYLGKQYSFKSGQDAHEAIRPTKLTNDYSKLDKYEQDAYKLILNRTIQSFMIPGINIIISELFSNGGEYFMYKHSKIEEQGFRNTNPVLEKPLLDINNPNLKIKEHETKPPAHFNQGSLIKKMKDSGIGRPSTYSSTISGLIKYGYLEENKVLLPTLLANDINEFLETYFADIIDSEYTSKMENQLDAIAAGEIDGRKELSMFFYKFEPRVEKVDADVSKKTPERIEGKCPDCGYDSLVVRNGKKGQFIGCYRFPKCKYTRSLD